MRLLALAVALVVLLAACGSSEPSTAEPASEAAFGESEWSTDFSRHSVPLGEISSGGPSKDGIPAIDQPRFVTARDAQLLGEREPVLRVEIGDEVRAYPIRILIWHEIVNDTLGGTPIAVTYCPLCNTALVFDRRLDDRVLDFGTTGRLRNSDLVMYDRQTESWWQQFTGEAIVGELTGSTLERVSARLVAADQFRSEHPDAEVLSEDTGHDRPYGRNPYTGYDSPGAPLYFGAANSDDRRLDAKERVVFIDRGDDSVAIPFEALAQTPTLRVTVADEPLTVRWQDGVASALDTAAIASGRSVGAAQVTDSVGEAVPFDEPFWFAVAAFRPDVRVVEESE